MSKRPAQSAESISSPSPAAAAPPRAFAPETLAARLSLSSFNAAQAQTRFPERTISIIVPLGPGGTTDIMMRILADEYGRQLVNNGRRNHN
jgi:tripartite-type tricarboxylate transporter receptor subunit TctC